MQIGLTHLDVFFQLGAFSAPMRELDVKTSYAGVIGDTERFNARVRLLWRGAGSEEPRIRDAVKRVHEALEAGGIRHVYVESPGTSHEWQTWRRALHEFAPRLFRD
jgi:enterochelin esterase family protein